MAEPRPVPRVPWNMRRPLHSPSPAPSSRPPSQPDLCLCTLWDPALLQAPSTVEAHSPELGPTLSFLLLPPPTTPPLCTDQRSLSAAEGKPPLGELAMLGGSCGDPPEKPRGDLGLRTQEHDA